MNRSLLKSEGFIFIIKFLCLFILFYYFNLFFISITSRGGNGFFIFLKQNLDYIDWLRYSILHTGKALCKLIGVKCNIENIYFIRLDDKSSGLRMVYRCVGYGVMSFWAAFVLANKSRLVKKIYWVLLGWIVIWIINCIRVVLLLTALEKNWSVNKYVDHHALFNIVAYGFIFLLIFTYLYLDIPQQKTT